MSGHDANPEESSEYFPVLGQTDQTPAICNHSRDSGELFELPTMYKVWLVLSESANQL